MVQVHLGPPRAPAGTADRGSRTSRTVGVRAGTAAPRQVGWQPYSRHPGKAESREEAPRARRARRSGLRRLPPGRGHPRRAGPLDRGHLGPRPALTATRPARGPHRGLSSAGRALPLQGRSQGFESPSLHVRRGAARGAALRRDGAAPVHRGGSSSLPTMCVVEPEGRWWGTGGRTCAAWTVDPDTASRSVVLRRPGLRATSPRPRTAPLRAVARAARHRRPRGRPPGPPRHRRRRGTDRAARPRPAGRRARGRGWPPCGRRARSASRCWDCGAAPLSRCSPRRARRSTRSCSGASPPAAGCAARSPSFEPPPDAVDLPPGVVVGAARCTRTPCSRTWPRSTSGPSCCRAPRACWSCAARTGRRDAAVVSPAQAPDRCVRSASPGTTDVCDRAAEDAERGRRHRRSRTCRPAGTRRSSMAPMMGAAVARPLRLVRCRACSTVAPTSSMDVVRLGRNELVGTY